VCWRGVFGPKRDELTGEWRKLYNDELNYIYSSPSIVRMIKSRCDVRSIITPVGRKESYTVFWWENLRERDHLLDPGVDGRIILSWVIMKWHVAVWTGLSWLGIKVRWRALVNAVLSLQVQ
jgi:hypothetical protein